MSTDVNVADEAQLRAVVHGAVVSGGGARGRGGGVVGSAWGAGDAGAGGPAGGAGGLRRGAGGAGHSGPGVCVLTGGQTGVDTWAAQAALRAGLPVHLIFPRGYRQEDGPLTSSRRARLRGATFHQLGSVSFRYRTWTSVYLSDAVVLLDPAGGGGCRETARAARHLGRPLLAPEPGQADPASISAFLASTDAQVIMIAGCRASVLARARASRGVRLQIEAVLAAVRQQADRMASYREGERAGRHRVRGKG